MIVKKQVTLDAVASKCMMLSSDCDLWPWKPVQRCPLTWWIFM